MAPDGLTGTDGVTAGALPGGSATPGGARRQRIPRPPGVRPGGPPPWAGLPESRRRGIGLARVRGAVGSAGRPGEAASAASMGPDVPLVDARPAAVLCALFEEAGEARVVLTRRSAGLRSHTGEVSFPGGRLEPGEPPACAALREAHEEIGLDPATVEIVGELSPVSTYTSRSSIMPFVGALAGRPSLVPNPAEVEHVLDVALATLTSDSVYRCELWDLPGAGWREMYLFELEHDVVWGATARMLRELLDLLFEGPGPGVWP